MPNGAVLLNAYPDKWVKLTCDRCGRKGRYLKGNLIMKHGPEMPLPSLLATLANCERHGQHQGCDAKYENLVPEQ
jgi:hypothetical protein